MALASRMRSTITSPYPGPGRLYGTAGAPIPAAIHLAGTSTSRAARDCRRRLSSRRQGSAISRMVSRLCCTSARSIRPAPLAGRLVPQPRSGGIECRRTRRRPACTLHVGRERRQGAGPTDPKPGDHAIVVAIRRLSSQREPKRFAAWASFRYGQYASRRALQGSEKVRDRLVAKHNLCGLKARRDDAVDPSAGLGPVPREIETPDGRLMPEPLAPNLRR